MQEKLFKEEQDALEEKNKTAKERAKALAK